ncbi:MAG TPA: response regulator [Gammaproteobacteria bacterium]
MLPLEQSLILIVDDKDAARYVNERTLRNAGFRTAEASCGEEAIALMRKLKPDLVLLDVAMPDIDGYEVCARVRGDETICSTAIIMLSATFESAEHQVRGLEGGADTFLVAPMEPAVLVATVRAMLRLKRAETQLREFDRRKDEFLATLAHELRNPLAPLLYCLDVIERESGNDRLADTLSIMRRQTEHLVRLVDDLVDMGRITQNKLTLKVESVALREVIDTAVEARRPELDAKHQTLSVEMPEDEILLRADRVRLSQVFGNLISNSIKYSGNGGRIRIEASREPGHVAISITDDGIGMLADDLDRVFGLFVQARQPGTGLGIGLALAQRIVEMHGGTIAAASEGLQRGSTFTVRLPVQETAGEYPLDVEPLDDSGTSTPKKVLVTDDNEDSADAMAHLLRLMNHDVRASYSGREAVDIAREFKPDVVFVDISMPDMDGFETVRAIRGQPWSAATLICTLSGHGQTAHRQGSAAAGADRHLVKPMGRKTLEGVLRSVRRVGAVTAQ